MKKSTEAIPLLTVAMPVYNDVDLLPSVMESVLNQTFDDFIFIYKIIIPLMARGSFWKNMRHWSLG